LIVLVHHQHRNGAEEYKSEAASALSEVRQAMAQLNPVVQQLQKAVDDLRTSNLSSSREADAEDEESKAV